MKILNKIMNEKRDVITMQKSQPAEHVSSAG